MLLTEDRPHPEEHWLSQLPRLLEPQGVVAYVARNGREAIGLAEQFQFHAAVIDLGTPTEPAARNIAETWLLELIARLPQRPPMVVLRGPAYNRAQAERLLRDALRLGAFSVLDKPVQIEQLLNVLRRLIDRHYHGQWPR